MKKKLLVLLLVTAPFWGIKSQAFTEGSSFVNVGYGFGNITQSLLRAAADESKTNVGMTFVGPLFFKYETAITQNIGIGLNVAHASADIWYNHTDKKISDGSTLLKENAKWSSTSFLLRFNFHFGSNEKVDPYFGLGAGYRAGTWSVANNDPAVKESSLKFKNPINIGLDMTFGSRFLFNEIFGAYVEVGLAKAVVQAGLTAKF